MADKYAPQARYDAANTRRINIKLNRKTDADIIEMLEAAESKQALIKQALRQLKGKQDGHTV